MAIPTQFSVANKAKRPIANPDVAQDLANVISAESIGFISGATALPSKTPSETGYAVIIDSEDSPIIDSATPASAQSAPAFSAPSAITPKSGSLASPPFPLNHARILYKNELVGSTITSTAADSNPSYAVIPNTWQKWSFRANTEAIEFRLQDNVAMDTICIGAHNLGDTGATYRIFYSTNTTGSWIPLEDAATQTNDAIMFHRETAFSARRIRIEFSGTLAVKQAGYISAGVALQMQRPFFNGHQPYTDSDVTEYYAKRTESGERIGRDIRRKGFETSFEWSNLDDEWYRSYIPEFKQYAKINPLFVAWNLLEYPSDVAFGETTDDMKASMQNGTRVKRDGFGFTLVGV